jgi:hypothetical protein
MAEMRISQKRAVLVSLAYNPLKIYNFNLCFRKMENDMTVKRIRVGLGQGLILRNIRVHNVYCEFGMLYQVEYFAKGRTVARSDHVKALGLVKVNF